MKLKYLGISLFISFFFINFAHAEINFEQNCLTQLSNSAQQHLLEIENISYDNFQINHQENTSSVDPLLVVYFDNHYIQTKKVGTGTESNLQLKDIMNVYNLFDSGLTEEYLYSQEYGTQSLNINGTQTPLYCYASNYVPLTEKDLDNLEKGDFTIIESPSVFEINTVNGYKEVYIEKTIQDKNAIPLFTKKSLFIIPFSADLENLYDVYSLIDTRPLAWEDFQEIAKELYEKVKDKESFQQIYQNDDITIEIANQISNGIKPIFINKVIFTHTYFAWNRHFVYIEMLLSDQDLVKNIISLGNKNFPKEEDEISWLDWIQFFRYEAPLDLNKLEIANYFKQPRNIARYEYYYIKANDKNFSREQIKQFQDYLASEIENNPEDYLDVLKAKVENDYIDFKQFLPISTRPAITIKIEKDEFFTYPVAEGYDDYEITLSNGEALPEWVTFNKETLLISATGGDLNSINIQVWGKNQDEKYVLSFFTLEVVEELEIPEEAGFLEPKDNNNVEKNNFVEPSEFIDKKFQKDDFRINIYNKGIFIAIGGLIIIFLSLILKKIRK